MQQQDVRIIKVDLSQHDFIYLLPLSDLHIGAPQTDLKAIRGYVQWIAQKKNAYTILNGDLFNAATKHSTSELYEYDEMITPDKELVMLEELLNPIRKKILAACSGGHELKNLFKAVGSDYTWHLMRNLGREEVYTRDGGVLLLKIKALNSRDNIFFSAVYTHGWGGARTRGAKIRKLEYLAEAWDADMYILSHDHTQNLSRSNYLTIPRWDTVNPVVRRKMLISTGGFLGYAGYPMRAGYQPADMGTPRIRIGKKIDEHGIIRKDIHSSI
tara:strand:- start:255 stop:1067 length:813 start_codon:yes stop_codon:yes gene_type:complete